MRFTKVKRCLNGIQWVLLFTLCVFCLPSNADLLSDQQPIYYLEDSRIEDRGSTDSYLKDGRSDLSVDAIYHSFQTAKANPESGWQGDIRANLNLGFHQTPFWFVWPLDVAHMGQPENVDGKDHYVLSIHDANIDRLNIWLINETGDVLQSHQLGDLKPYRQSREIRHRGLAVKLAIPSDIQTYAVVYIENKDAIRFYPELWSESDFEDHRRSVSVIDGIYLGIMMSMVLYNLVLAFGIRDSAFFCYVAWVIAIGITIVADRGIAYEYLWPNSPYWNSVGITFSGFLAAAIGPLFISELLNLRHKMRPACLAIIYGFVLLNLCFAVTTFFVDCSWSFRLNRYMALAAAALVIGLLIYLLPREGAIVKMLLVAWSAMAIGTYIGIGVILGWVPQNEFTNNSLWYGSSLEVILMSLILINRVRVDRIQKMDAQNKLIEAQLNLNLELELRVKKRTEELQLANERLHTASVTDELTGLFNRRFFTNSLRREVSRAIRESQSLCVLMIDLDRFKRINDKYGHPTGDLCLRYAAEVMSEQVARQSDILARVGGEEFVIVLLDTEVTAGLSLAASICESLRSKPIDSGEESFTLTCSIGVFAHRPKESGDSELLTKRADEALYAAKAQGRDCVVSWTEDLIGTHNS